MGMSLRQMLQEEKRCLLPAPRTQLGPEEAKQAGAAREVEAVKDKGAAWGAEEVDSSHHPLSIFVVQMSVHRNKKRPGTVCTMLVVLDMLVGPGRPVARNECKWGQCTETGVPKKQKQGCK